MKRSANPNIFLGLALATILGGGAAAYFQYGNVSAQEAKVAELRGKLQDEGEVQATLTKSETDLAECSAKLEHLERSVSTAAYVPTMLTELEKIGKANGIVVTGVRPMPEVKKKEEQAKRTAYQELGIEVKGRGGYYDVMRFVQSLQKFPKIVAARTVSVIPPNVGNDHDSVGKLDVTLELRAYIFPPDMPKAKDVKEEGQVVEETTNG